MPDAPGRTVEVLDVDAPALVLGSTQPDGGVDGAAAARLGVSVVRRRSGGGAVLLVPGEVVWLDVVLPRGDPLWDDDVGRSFAWLGAAWAEALRSLGHDTVEVHGGGLVTTRWSPQVCFAGLGPGEVTVGGRKAVGLSQRRTRAGARFQCAVPLAWDPESLVALLGLPAGALADLAAAVHPVTAPADDLVAAFCAALPDDDVTDPSRF